MSPARPPPAGFTIIELLVVVTIIGLLVAMLLPTLGRAKEQTRLAMCKNNLHNVGLAVTAYGDDNGGRLPLVEKLDNPHTELLAALGPYAGSAKNYYCPSLDDPSLRYSLENVQAGSIGYFYYSCRTATPDARVSTFLRWEVAWPRKLDCCRDGQAWVMSDRWFSGLPTAHRFYPKGVNYLMTSGSVSMVEDSPRQGFN